jgi:hypothetical protein
MFRVASLVLSLLALHVLYWYKRKNADAARLEPHHKYSVYLLYWYFTGTKVQILTLRAASQGSTFWRFIWTAFMCQCHRFCLMSKVPYALMRIPLRMRMESVAVI